MTKITDEFPYPRWYAISEQDYRKRGVVGLRNYLVMHAGARPECSDSLGTRMHQRSSIFFTEAQLLSLGYRPQRDRVRFTLGDDTCVNAFPK